MTRTEEENHRVMQSDMHKGSQSSFFEAEIEHILNEDDEVTMITIEDERKQKSNENNNDDDDDDDDDDVINEEDIENDHDTDDTKYDSETMATTNNMRSNSSNLKNKSENAIDNNSNNNYLNNFTTTSSSSVIESLHEQIDVLTNTNLKLTVQSHNLLEDLEHFQKKEIKLNENISLYNHEYENLNLMLQRKVRKIHSTEEEVNHIKEKLIFLQNENEILTKKISDMSSITNDTKLKINNLKEKYSILLEDHESYKSSCLDEMADLRNEIDQFKQSVVTDIVDQSGSIEPKMMNEKIHQFKKDSAIVKETHLLDENIILQHQINSIVESRKMKVMLDLFKIGNNVAIDYNNQSEETNFSLPDHIKDSNIPETLEKELKLGDKKSHINSRQIKQLHEGPLSNRLPGDFSPTLGRTRLTPIINSGPRTNANVNTNSTNIPSVNGNATTNNNNSNNKNRRSFYSSISGGQLPGTRIGSNGALPGMRKTSNERDTPPLASSEKFNRTPSETINPFTNRASKQLERRKR
ncbi:similar to Torulaspora delbrueckii TDEL_0C05300 hypothetical protein [Maudiozyma saulgeensis]|uniref:SWI5-dependent HO expression protein 3 n=1 Tax=Maudiozyma saulgeensis TaxID=1789683 RepID=A0A1X7QXH0_9SACH|nr:similar to Torulaspora delbrueckii TDEL_0C05300 hypothetical protein [Kazachstania saulgeensis]